MTRPRAPAWEALFGLASIAILGLALAIAILVRPTWVVEASSLLPAINLVFLVVIPVAIAVVAAIGYIRHGAAVFLATGTGMVAVAVGVGVIHGMLATTLGEDARDTVQSMAILALGACLVVGGLATRTAVSDGRRRRRDVAVWYGVVLAAIGLLTFLAFVGLTPDFHVPGEGSTPLRNLVLGLAFTMFAIASMSWYEVWSRDRQFTFVAWYATGLCMFTMSLVGLIMAGIAGSLVSWVGLVGACAGGVFTLVALLSVAGGSGAGGKTGPNVRIRLVQARMVFRPFVDSLRDPVFTLDQRGRVLYGNASAQRVFGSRVAEGIDRALAAVVAPGARFAEVDAMIDDLVRSATLGADGAGGIRFAELELLGQDGVPFSAEIAVVPNVVDPSMTICFVRDISAIHAATAAAHETERRYRSILKTALDGFWVTDLAGRLLDVNDAYCAMSGYTREELLAMKVANLECVDGPDEVALNFERLRRLGSDRFESRHRRKDGTPIDVEVSVQLRRDDADHTIVFIRDITQRKIAEHEIRVLTEDLERRVAERTARLEAANEELQTFSYSVSHDLRSPLRAMTGFAELLVRHEGDKLNAKSRHYLENIVEGGQRMGILIEELLTYSRLGQSHVHAEPVLLGPVLVRLRETLAARIKAQHATLAVAEPLAVPLADPMLLEEVLTNLLDNAFTYCRPDVKTVVSVTAVPMGKRVILSVADNGIGIPEDYFERILDPFVRLHSSEEYPGTGIGLATVRKAAWLMGSDIHVESEVGVGSTFSLDLPAAREDGT